MKGGGQKQSCYGYWVWIWQDWLTACDGTHNDILPHSAFVEVVWAPLRANRLEDENGAWTSDVLYEEVELVWKDRKYERDYGFLKTFLEVGPSTPAFPPPPPPHLAHAFVRASTNLIIRGGGGIPYRPESPLVLSGEPPCVCVCMCLCLLYDCHTLCAHWQTKRRLGLLCSS